MKELCIRVKEVRNAWAYNQVEFAQRLGVTNAHISAIEKGKTAPSASLIKLICKEFKINEQWLRTGKGLMEEEELETDIDNKMAYATTKFNVLLKKDNTIRSMAAELDVLFANIVSLDIENQELLVEYLNNCHKIFYHLNNYLEFQKKTALSGQQNMFSFPDDLQLALTSDIDNFQSFFKKLAEQTP